MLDMKDSGVEWIGKIPKDWNLTKLKYLSNKSVQYGLNIDADSYNDSGVRFLRITDINQDGSLKETGCVYLNSSDVPSEYYLNQGDVLFARSGSVGKSTLINDDSTLMSFAGYLVRFSFDDYSTSKFVKWMAESEFYWRWIHIQIIQSTIPNVNGEKYSNLVFPLPPPPLEKQGLITLISRYLDKKAEQIDSLIEKVQTKIELLKEQRMSLINQSVTKGLTPNVEMKDSGVEWIGQIPKHWEVKKITYVASSVSSGTTPKADNFKYYEQGSINWLVIGDLNDGYITESKNKITELAFKKHSALKIYPVDSVLVAIYGSIGKLGILKIPATVNQAICVLSFIDSQSNDFWFYALFAHRQYIVSLQHGGSQPNINQEVIKNLRFPAPSDIEEQKRIARYLDKKTEQLDALIEKNQKKIELLKEYRQSLISSVVTGKVKITKDMI